MEENIRAACRRSLGRNLALASEASGRWKENPERWHAWVQQCESQEHLPYLLRAQYYAGESVAQWEPWSANSCIQPLSLHQPLFQAQFKTGSLSECQNSCLHFHQFSLADGSWESMQRRHLGCRSLMFWNSSGECRLFSPGCISKHPHAEYTLHFTEVSSREKPGHSHWTEFGVCMPRFCVGAEAEDFAIFQVQALVPRPVFRWHLTLVSAQEASAPAVTERQQENMTTAVCVEGPANRIDFNTLESQMRNLIGPMRSHVVVVVSASHTDDCERAWTQVEAVYGAHLAAWHCQLDSSDDALRDEFMARVRNNPRPGFAAAWEETLVSQLGNAFFHSTSYGQRDGEEQFRVSFLRAFLSKEHCRLLLQTVVHRATSPLFSVGYLRFEDYVVTPYPTLDLLKDDGIWIPDGDDWSGFNDRHAFGRQDAMLVYLSLYQALVAGDLLLHIFKDCSLQRRFEGDSVGRICPMNPERILKIHLMRQRVRVRRMPPVTARRCGLTAGPGRPCHDASFVFGALGFRDKFASNDVHGLAWWIYAHKYTWFRTKKFRTLEPSCSDWFGHDGGGAERLVRARGLLQKDFLPEDVALTLDMCCDEELFGVNGLYWCWQEPFFDFSRCCTESLELSIRPAVTALQANHIQTESNHHLACWPYGHLSESTPVRICA